VSYLSGGLDIPLLLDYLKFGHEQPVTQAPGPSNQASIPLEKDISSPKQPQGEAQNTAKTKDESKAPTPALTPSSSAGEVKGDRIPELETPTAGAQKKSGTERAEEKLPLVTTNNRPNVPEIAAKQESQPGPVQNRAFIKTECARTCSLSGYHTQVPLLCLSGLL